jgi:hypothetical protein
VGHLLPGGYGSAGDGARSARRTSTGAGVGGTALVADLAIGRQPLPVVHDPTDEEIRRGIADQQCPWCDDSRTFRALSIHLSKGHGINLVELRDRLVLPKASVMVSRETHDRRVEISRAQYDPSKLVTKGGPRALSAFGRASQKEKGRAAKFSQYGERGRKTRACVICEGEFTSRDRPRARTCSPSCEGEFRSRKSKGRPNTWTLKGHPNDWARVYKTCKWCGGRFWGHRLTCSDECAALNRSATARARVDHRLDKAREAHLANLRARPSVLCSVEGCARSAICKGLCRKDYQRQGRALKLLVKA